jgi:hypothetical protein
MSSVRAYGSGLRPSPGVEADARRIPEHDALSGKTSNIAPREELSPYDFFF